MLHIYLNIDAGKPQASLAAGTGVKRFHEHVEQLKANMVWICTSNSSLLGDKPMRFLLFASSYVMQVQLANAILGSAGVATIGCEHSSQSAVGLLGHITRPACFQRTLSCLHSQLQYTSVPGDDCGLTFL